MKILYTSIRHSLTDRLSQLASDYARQNKRVFYIAPNSLSFDMERKVLEALPEQASFKIIVTRFGQLARYLMMNQTEISKPIDDIGLSMIFFRVLSQLDEKALKIYGKLSKDFGFIQQLISLYKELQRANLSILDLEAMNSPDKQADLVTIFLAVTEILKKEGFDFQSTLAQLTSVIESGQLDEQLEDTVLIIDGFSRFSAEEEALVAAFEARVEETIVGVYTSQTAFKETYIEGNVYQANVEFITHLAARFQAKATCIGEDECSDSLGKLSYNIECSFDYSNRTPLELTKEDKQKVALWVVANQKEEVEQVATAIRQHLHKGGRYKDILVLLGDVDSYKLQIGKIFDKYEIPYYFGKAEEMHHHPLVQLIESLERVRRYHFRAEDVLNLLKSGLYGKLAQEEMDLFESYVIFTDLKGKAAFSRPFTPNSRADYDPAVLKAGKLVYDLTVLERVRQAVMQPLENFLNPGKHSGSHLLEQLMGFLDDIGLAKNMEAGTVGLSEMEIEKEEQVWKSFIHILETIQQIFGKELLKVEEFLALLHAGMQASQYRTVPATVDVVQVASYELVVPHSAKYVYALGMGRSNFPKITKNTSLLTEEEMENVNQAVASSSRFDLVSRENIKKNHATFLSLINAASQKLTISSPQIYNEGEDQLSPYVQLLQELGFSLEERGQHAQIHPQDIGHYKSLLSLLIGQEGPAFEGEEWEGQADFWTALLYHLKNRLETEGVSIPTITGDIQSTPLSQETLAALYPEEQALELSSSSLTNYYNNEYLYFIRNVLRLKEQESIHPTSFQHGRFLHRIFEKIGAVERADEFDKLLKKAIEATTSEPEFVMFYNQDAETLFTKEVLENIAQASATVIRENDLIRIKELEKTFRQERTIQTEASGNRILRINGIIDRLDSFSLNQTLGVVDYKSSDQGFSLSDFYNGLKPQLVTYLAALKQLDETSTQTPFGAMYLHLQDPIIRLKDTNNQEQLEKLASTSLVYKGLFVKEASQGLNHFYHKGQTYTETELETLLEYNHQLYTKAAKKILTGQFAINPYTKDERSVAGEQLKAITGFEADRHMGMARRLATKLKRQELLERMKEEDV